jgi:cytochrome c peroxidase
VDNKTEIVALAISLVKEHADDFARSSFYMQEKMQAVKNGDEQSVGEAKQALKACRIEYKRIEFFMEYFLPSSSIVYNAPAKYEVEEPFMEYREPEGLQVMEAMLFSKDPYTKKKSLTDQAALISSSASDIKALLYNMDISDKQVLESARLELIRVMTLGITGYDAPELKSGIEESAVALQSLGFIFTALIGENPEADSCLLYLRMATATLDNSPGFDAFNRMQFLIGAALPLQQHLSLFIQKKGLAINSTKTLNYQVKNIYSRGAIQVYPSSPSDSSLVRLGRKLFFDPSLSGNSIRSCASCHQQEHYFSERIPKSLSLDGKQVMQRNAPSLFYSGYQYAQFWDGRAKSLEEQILSVLANTLEMGSDHASIVQRLKGNQSYQKAFTRAFADERENAININHVSKAIAAFLETLAPFSSPFDRYIQGDRHAMSKEEVHGFNLFMGKGLCGTCHFSPVFNGLVPPLYNRTELEVAGMPGNGDLDNPLPDTDSGRFETYPIKYYNGAFKTPTVRNVANTAPYMHNGAFKDLKTVIEFYNRGGGNGIGLTVPEQTLASKPLQLDSTEEDHLIRFLHSLTDDFKPYPVMN